MLFFDLDAVHQANKLSYEEQALAFTLQGLVNRRPLGEVSTVPLLFFSAGVSGLAVFFGGGGSGRSSFRPENFRPSENFPSKTFPSKNLRVQG